MTTELDALTARLEELERRAGIEVNPLGVDANGWPSYVAPGELIESSWGNAVVDHTIRVVASSIRYTPTGDGPQLGGPSVVDQLVNVPMEAGHLYRCEFRATAVCHYTPPNLLGGAHSGIELWSTGATPSLIKPLAAETATWHAASVSSPAGCTGFYRSPTTQLVTLKAIYGIVWWAHQTQWVNYTINNGTHFGQIVYDLGMTPAENFNSTPPS